MATPKYTLAGIGLTFFCIAILTNKLDMARMIMFLRQDIMVVLTTGALCQTLLGFFGMFGALTHRKKFLAVYLLLLWVVGGIFMTNGFLAYKEVYSFQFEANMSTLWTKLGSKQVTIQNKVIIVFSSILGLITSELKTSIMRSWNAAGTIRTLIGHLSTQNVPVL